MIYWLSFWVFVDHFDWLRCRKLQIFPHLAPPSVVETFTSNFGHPAWAQMVDIDSTNHIDTAHVTSVTSSGPSGASTIQISQAEYNRLHRLELSQNSYSTTHAPSSGMNVYIVSPHRPWILD